MSPDPSFELDVGRDAKAKRTETYLLPVVVDDVAVVGISKDVGHVDLRRMTVREAAELLIKKIEDGAQAQTGEEVGSSSR